MSWGPGDVGRSRGGVTVDVGVLYSEPPTKELPDSPELPVTGPLATADRVPPFGGTTVTHLPWGGRERRKPRWSVSRTGVLPTRKNPYGSTETPGTVSLARGGEVCG